MPATLRHNMSVITLVLPRQRTAKLLNDVFADDVHSAFLSSARGTLIQDKWYQTLLPMLSPELEMVQLIAPDNQVDRLMRRLVRHAQLYRSGSGVVYSSPCDDLYATGDFPLWPLESAEKPCEDASVKLHENLTAIHFISQGERTDTICRAAMNAGAHGPIVQYSRGIGLRDRLGWLRITSKSTKEVVSVLVDTVEADFVFAAMAEAGQVDRPGRGVIYRMPVQKGLVNMDSVYSRARHTATMQQIIRALDEIKGGRDWRDQAIMDVEGGEVEDLRFIRMLNQAEHKPITRLSVIVDRFDSNKTANQIIQGGAPGVNINYLQMHKAVDGKDNKQHRPLAHIRAVLPEQEAFALQKHLAQALEQDALIYTQPAGISLSFQDKENDAVVKPGRVYRGGAH